MKKIALVFIGMALAVLLSLGVLSQLSPITYSESSVEKLTNAISVEEIQDCNVEFFNEIEEIYENCNYYRNYTTCTNVSGPGTGCLSQQDVQIFNCKSSQVIHVRNQSTCVPKQKIFIEVDEGWFKTSKKELDFSSFGPCKQEIENDCLVITCVSAYDGAHNGKFVDCLGGKSCQKAVIC